MLSMLLQNTVSILVLIAMVICLSPCPSWAPWEGVEDGYPVNIGEEKGGVWPVGAALWIGLFIVGLRKDPKEAANVYSSIGVADFRTDGLEHGIVLLTAVERSVFGGPFRIGMTYEFGQLLGGIPKARNIPPSSYVDSGAYFADFAVSLSVAAQDWAAIGGAVGWCVATSDRGDKEADPFDCSCYNIGDGASWHVIGRLHPVGSDWRIKPLVEVKHSNRDILEKPTVYTPQKVTFNMTTLALGVKF